jgi:hypothetical protein
MNDSDTLPLHMLDVRELTPDAFTPFGQVIAPIRTGDQGAETHYDPETSAGSCRAY